jgi:hypothetical protein
MRTAIELNHKVQQEKLEKHIQNQEIEVIFHNLKGFLKIQNYGKVN